MTTLKTPPTAASGNPPSGTATIAILNPLEDASWDRKIAAFADATCFHTAGWARVIHDTYGFAPCYFAAARPGGFDSLLPVMGVSSVLTGRRGVSLPFTDCCDPLRTPGQDVRPLLAAAVRHAEAQSWRYVEFRTGKGIPPAAPATVRYFIHRLCLKHGEDAAWSGLNGAARRSVRKARESGVTVATGQDRDALKEFFRLHCLTRKRLGVPPQSFTFFANIGRHLLDHNLATIFLASYRGRNIAAAIFLHFGTSVMFKFGASDLAYQQLRANNLLMWEAISHFAAQGRHDFHLGRNETDNPGLRRYKLAWGSTEGELAYHRYFPARGDFVVGRNPQQGWHHRAFRHIPGPLARIIGACVYPHMA